MFIQNTIVRRVCHIPVEDGEDTTLHGLAEAVCEGTSREQAHREIHDSLMDKVMNEILMNKCMRAMHKILCLRL